MMNSRMKSCRIQAISLALAALISLPLRADVIPGRWEKVLALPVSSPITVELKDGDRIKGHYEGLSATDIMVVSHFSRAVIPKEDIETITIQPEDGVGDGAGIGAGIGFGVGTAIVLGAMAKHGGGEGAIAALLLFAGLGAGVGAGLGAAADAATRPVEIVLYEAP